MSDAVSALKGQTFEGRVHVADAGLQGMITLRIDATDANAVSALGVAGFAMPSARGAQGTLAGGGTLWMSPDEVLLLCPYDDVDDTVQRVQSHLSEHHALVADVSDARCVVRLTGENSELREVLAKLTPADMRADQFGVGTLRRTRLAQVPAAIWFEDENTAIVVAFRSVADYVFKLLSNAASGPEVGYF